MAVNAAIKLKLSLQDAEQAGNEEGWLSAVCGGWSTEVCCFDEDYPFLDRSCEKGVNE